MPKSTESSGSGSGWLPDVNVWLALCSDRHEHHQNANEWFAGVRDPVYFCRVTQMALLRLLTNPVVMGEDLLTPSAAVSVYRELMSDERVNFAQEPHDAETLWFSLMMVPSAKGSVWTDAWLAAFSRSHGSRLVSFDAGMQRWSEASAGLSPKVLRG
jgi:toxin-antitoxin system PIN domain toxin